MNKEAMEAQSDQYFEDQASFLFKKAKLERIDNFNGYFDFLNNDYPTWVYYEDLLFPCVSAAFQAARSDKQHIREKISKIDTPQELFDIAINIEDPPNWIQQRLKIMEILLRDKFRRSRELRDKLKATGDRELINTYSDPAPSNFYWGIVNGKGQNQLGRLLEAIREDILKNMDLEKWIMFVFKPEEDTDLMPKLKMNVIKEGQAIDQIELKGKSYYILGQFNTCHLLLAHPTISRQHACILVDQKQTIGVIDLQSKSGTYVNDKLIDPMLYQVLQSGDKLRFAASTRTYEIEVDFTQVKINLISRQANLQKQLRDIEKINQPQINKDDLRQTLGVSNQDTIFVSNLPDDISHLEMQLMFGQFGTIKEVKIPIDRNTGKQKNIALIIFQKEEDARMTLLKSDRLVYKEKKLKVQLADSVKTQKLLDEIKQLEIKEQKLREKQQKQLLKEMKKQEQQQQKHHSKDHDSNDGEEKEKEQKREKEHKRKSRSKEKKNHKKDRDSRSRSKHKKHHKSHKSNDEVNTQSNQQVKEKKSSELKDKDIQSNPELIQSSNQKSEDITNANNNENNINKNHNREIKKQKEDEDDDKNKKEKEYKKHKKNKKQSKERKERSRSKSHKKKASRSYSKSRSRSKSNQKRKRHSQSKEKEQKHSHKTKSISQQKNGEEKNKKSTNNNAEK